MDDAFSCGYSAVSMIANLKQVSEYVSFITKAIITYKDLIFHSEITRQLTCSLNEHKDDVLKSFKQKCKAIHTENWISNNSPDSSSYINKEAPNFAVMSLDWMVSRFSSAFE